MYKKFIFILSVFILVFSVVSINSFADGGVLGLTYDVPESPDYPNHTYIFIYERFLGGASGGSAGDGVFMLKYYMPIVLEKRSDVRLQLKYTNGLHYRYNDETESFEPVFSSTVIGSDSIPGFYYNEDMELVPWNDPDVFYYGFRPLASNHNIHLSDDTLFFLDSSDEHELPPPVPTPGDPNGQDPSGGWWSDAWDSIGDFWDSIGDFFGGALDFLISPLTSIGEALGGFANGLLELKNNVSNFFSNFWSGLIGIFVPEDGFLEERIETTKALFSETFGGVIEMKEGILNSISQIHNEEFAGIKINFDSSFLPISGEYYILEPAPVNWYSYRIKPWISGLMIFLTGTYFLRKIISIIRGTSPL